MAGFGFCFWLAFRRVSDGFWLDSRSGLELAWFKQDLAFGLLFLGLRLYLVLGLARFRLALAWLWVDSGLISA